MFEDLEDCIQHNGKQYCWNYRENQLEEIIRKPMEISKCPPDALKKLMEHLSKKKGK